MVEFAAARYFGQIFISRFIERMCQAIVFCWFTHSSQNSPLSFSIVSPSPIYNKFKSTTITAAHYCLHAAESSSVPGQYHIFLSGIVSCSCLLLSYTLQIILWVSLHEKDSCFLKVKGTTYIRCSSKISSQTIQQLTPHNFDSH